MYDNIDNPHNESGIPIGQQIRSLRTERGWSLAELARRAGTSAPTLHRYENGWDRFEVATLRRIAAALGAHLDIRLVQPASPRPEHRLDETELLELISPLFWDRDLDPAHLNDNPTWVAGRVLMYGNMTQARAIRTHYGDDLLRDAVNTRGVDDRTKTFWSLILEKTEDASESP